MKCHKHTIYEYNHRTRVCWARSQRGTSVVYLRLSRVLLFRSFSSVFRLKVDDIVFSGILRQSRVKSRIPKPENRREKQYNDNGLSYTCRGTVVFGLFRILATIGGEGVKRFGKKNAQNLPGSLRYKCNVIQGNVGSEWNNPRNHSSVGFFEYNYARARAHT